jgi:hypothetical protein
MKYNEILEVDSVFQDVYDITAEQTDYWRCFIPNSKFDSVLKSVIDCFEASELKNKKSIWLQGTYGTGKSHATSVIKHLLSDDYKNIEEYMERFTNNQVKLQLKNFRKTKKIFPVVLKGISNVTDHLSLNFVLQNTIKKTLINNSIFIETKSDFEIMIDKLNDEDLKEFWQRLIENEPELKQCANNTEDLIKELAAGSTETLRDLKKTVENKKGWYSGYKNITDWLLEVQDILKKKNIADYIVIFWDEFTSVLDSRERRGVLNQIQNIAELSKQGVYLFLVSHKKLEVIESFRDLREDEKTQANARFKTEDYSMQPLTTYHIISGAIKKKSKEEWLKMKQVNIDENSEVKTLINNLTGNENIEIKSKLAELYPFHPYSAYLSTVVSRDIGSTDRSIFKFLNDNDKGFKKFIENEIDSELFLTPDYVWDFFHEEFEKDTTSKFSPVIDKYNLFYDIVNQKSSNYLAPFKVVMLLNIMYRITTSGILSTENKLLVPFKENIVQAFAGTGKKAIIEEALKYFDENEIIHMSPEGIYEIAYSSLPQKEIEEEKRKEMALNEDLTKLLASFGPHKARLEKSIKDNFNRETEVAFFWAGEADHILKNKIDQSFNFSYAISMPVFLMRGSINLPEGIFKREERTYKNIQSYLLSLSSETENKNKIFVLIIEEFGGKNFERMMDYTAQYNVAKKHNINNEETTNYYNKAKKYLDNWLDSIKGGEVEIFFRGTSNKKTFVTLGKFIGDTFAKEIFFYGAETINDSYSNTNVWSKQEAKKVVEDFVFSDNRNDLIEKTKNAPKSSLHVIIKSENGDFIVDHSLKIREDINIQHTTITISNKVREVMEKQKGKTSFNLGDILKFLSESPYGLYMNMINMALLGFVMREYIGKIYEEGSGKLIDKHLMRDKVVSLFNYWQKGDDKDKLYLRFSTEEEKKLINVLKDIFNIDNVEGLNNVKWKLREGFVKKYSCPIWALKYSNINIGQNLKNLLDKLFKFTVSQDSEIEQEEICALLDLIDNNKLDFINLLKETDKETCLQKFYIEVLGDEFFSKSSLILEYLNKNMQEEIFSWEEDKIKIKILEWNLEESKKKNTVIHDSTSSTQSKSTETGNSNGNKDETIDNNKVERKKKTIDRVKNYSGSLDAIKQRIISLIESNPQLMEIVDKIFE